MHFTKPEREAIHNLKRWGFVDLFRQLNDEEKAYSWWSHFHHDFEKDRGLRIDHIWASPGLADNCTDCWIDKGPRGLTIRRTMHRSSLNSNCDRSLTDVA
jgi:exodeoxyribonuclease-3